MYTDPAFIASLLVVFGAIVVGAGFFIFIWIDNADHPGDDDSANRDDQ